jgi:hypothetical protein
MTWQLTSCHRSSYLNKAQCLDEQKGGKRLADFGRTGTGARIDVAAAVANGEAAVACRDRDMQPMDSMGVASAGKDSLLQMVHED